MKSLCLSGEVQMLKSEVQLLKKDATPPEESKNDEILDEMRQKAEQFKNLGEATGKA